MLDHPRRCGENWNSMLLLSGLWGSPPQVRGKLCSQYVQPFSFRITPAGAGKTGRRLRCLGFGQDHPRRCGENTQLSQSDIVHLGSPPQVRENFDFTDAQLRGKGSPPQVRGKLDSRSHNHVLTRITPAGAGKTNINRVARHNAEDHPRRCGENRFGFSVIFKQAGSPPQVRGKRTGTLKK